MSELGDKPASTVRITAIDHVIDNILCPRLDSVLPKYPDIHVEIGSECRMADIPTCLLPEPAPLLARAWARDRRHSLQGVSPPAPPAIEEPLYVYRSRTSVAVRAREQHGVNWSLTACSASLR